MNRFTRGLMGAASLAMIAVVPTAVPRQALMPAGSQATAAGGITATTVAQVSTTRVAVPAYVAPSRVLRLNSRGADVKALQQRLAALKYYPGKPDGVFGMNTLQAVAAFQGVQRLTIDGVVGAVTGRALVHPNVYQARHPGGGGLRVEINLTARVLVLYRDGKIALISHVSTGGGYRYCTASGCGWAITPTGSFKTTHYYPGWITVPLGRMYNSVFFIGTSYAMHGSTSVPLYPASHGCVRLPMYIAEFLHTMLKTPGTPVYIDK
jgi:lipoprotein-anchoring transpeptidase ErfK/SrfK